MITPKKWLALQQTMCELGIKECDLVERYIKGSGAGGQKINKTASCVLLTHTPSALVVKCQKTRSQKDNRFFARRLLCEKLAQQVAPELSKTQKKNQLTRRNKSRKLRRIKRKLPPPEQ